MADGGEITISCQCGDRLYSVTAMPTKRYIRMDFDEDENPIMLQWNDGEEPTIVPKDKGEMNDGR